MNTYVVLKHLHVACVALSATGFVLRAYWMLSGSALLRSRAARVLPHLVDSALLASAIALAVLMRQYPFEAPWVSAKVAGLLLYIALGAQALRGHTLRRRLAALAAALCTYAWIVSVALSKNPAGFLSMNG